MNKFEQVRRGGGQDWGGGPHVVAVEGEGLGGDYIFPGKC